MEDSTRSTLLTRLKDRGDAGAWGAFESLYRPLLVAYAKSRGLDTSDAEDVAQQCTQAVLEKIDDYQHLQSFKAWLRAIAEHKIIDRFRRLHGDVQADSDFWKSQQGTGGSSQPGAAADLWEAEWLRSHILHCAERVRGTVNESTYEAFSACVVRGMDPSVVAGLLNLTVNQVYVAKHRVLQRIRALLRDLHGQDGVL